jgi:hypothetical protein
LLLLGLALRECCGGRGPAQGQGWAPPAGECRAGLGEPFLAAGGGAAQPSARQAGRGKTVAEPGAAPAAASDGRGGGGGGGGAAAAAAAVPAGVGHTEATAQPCPARVPAAAQPRAHGRVHTHGAERTAQPGRPRRQPGLWHMLASALRRYEAVRYEAVHGALPCDAPSDMSGQLIAVVVPGDAGADGQEHHHHAHAHVHAHALPSSPFAPSPAVRAAWRRAEDAVGAAPAPAPAPAAADAPDAALSPCAAAAGALLLLASPGRRGAGGAGAPAAGSARTSVGSGGSDLLGFGIGALEGACEAAEPAGPPGPLAPRGQAGAEAGWGAGLPGAGAGWPPAAPHAGSASFGGPHALPSPCRRAGAGGAQPAGPGDGEAPNGVAALVGGSPSSPMPRVLSTVLAADAAIAVSAAAPGGWLAPSPQATRSPASQPGRRSDWPPSPIAEAAKRYRSTPGDLGSAAPLLPFGEAGPPPGGDQSLAWLLGPAFSPA